MKEVTRISRLLFGVETILYAMLNHRSVQFSEFGYGEVIWPYAKERFPKTNLPLPLYSRNPTSTPTMCVEFKVDWFRRHLVKDSRSRSIVADTCEAATKVYVGQTIVPLGELELDTHKV